MITFSAALQAENVTVSNHFDLPAWTFASVEALGDGDARLCGGKFRQNATCVGGSTQNHHSVTLDAFKGKPVHRLILWHRWRMSVVCADQDKELTEKLLVS